MLELVELEFECFGNGSFLESSEGRSLLQSREALDRLLVLVSKFVL